jgi:alcohol dehydrogenase class IV
MFEAELEEMAEAALADRCTASNPRNAAKEQIKEIYRRAYAGKIS